jgi:hypothetical protein
MKVLLFSPYQAIERHTFPEAYLAKTLTEAGHEVVYLGCDGILSRFCLAHSAHGLTEASSDEEREKVCRSCRLNRQSMSKNVAPFFLLEQYYDKTHDAEIEILADGLTPQNVYDFRYEGFPIGQLASYEFIIHYKIIDFEKTDPEKFEYYKIGFKNTMRTYFSVKAFLKKHPVDRVIVYNSCYSTNGIVRELGLKAGIPSGFIHAGINLRHFHETLLFTWQDGMDIWFKVMDYYREHKDRLSVDYSKYGIALDHIQELLSANSVFVYSKKRSGDTRGLLDKFKIDKDQKIALLSMSSWDEIYASDFAFMGKTYQAKAKSIFRDQADWIKNLVEHFRNKPEWKLIIRIHPREFPNKREGVISAKVKDYDELFSDLPVNVFVNRPSDGISIYDIFEIADIHLVAGSATGLETAQLGIPTVCAVGNCGLYPVDVINESPQTREGFFQVIDSILGGRYDRNPMDIAKRALHWSIFFHTQFVLWFDPDRFWTRAFDSSLTSRVRRRLVHELGMPSLSIEKYLAGVSQSDNEKRVLTEMLESGREELPELRNRLGLELSSPIQPYFRRYLIGIFSAYFGIQLGEYSRFSFSDDHETLEKECVFTLDDVVSGTTVERKKYGVVVRLPSRSKLSISLASMICKSDPDSGDWSSNVR